MMQQITGVCSTFAVSYFFLFTELYLMLSQNDGPNRTFVALHLCAEQLGKDEHHSTFICQRNMYVLSVNAATPGRQRDLVHV